MAHKKRAGIGLLFFLILVFALYSYFFIGGFRKKEPDRAKLVDTSEVIQDAYGGNLFAIPGKDNKG